MTRLKWLRASQPLPEDAPADRQIGARKVTDGREPNRMTQFAEYRIDNFGSGRHNVFGSLPPTHWVGQVTSSPNGA